MLPSSASVISPELDFHLSPHALTSSATILSTPPPPSLPGKCNAQTCPWWPYSSSQDFKNNASLILTILFCALILALALHAGIRYILRKRSRPNNHRETIGDIESAATEEKGASFSNLQNLEFIPTLIFSPGLELKGTEPECTICLTEFVEGDVIRVLDRCSHGFHAQCIQQWLVSSSSCPTCRASCFARPSISSSSINNECQVPPEANS